MDAYLTNNDWKGCQYVAVQAHRRLKDGTWTKSSKWAWITVDKIVEFSRRKKNVLTFCSIGHFEKADKLSKQISNQPFDFDCNDERQFWMARNSCLAIMDYFGDYGLDYEHIRVWFTGGRGYHIEIPHQVFNIEPQVELNLVMKHLASHVNSYLTDDAYCDDCLEVDLNIYKNPNQYRLPNSYRPDRKTYKIELSWDELKNLDKQQLMTLAANPRLPLYDIDTITFEPIDDAVEWYQERLKEYHAQQSQAQAAATTTPINPKHIKTMANNPIPITPKYLQVTNIPAGVPVCIADLRQHGIKKAGDRNKATMLDACFCRDAGVPLVDAKTIINTWVQTIPINMTGCKPGRERQNATHSNVDYIYNHTTYKFDCSYAIGLGLTCNQEGCPLYQQKAFQKWTKNIKIIPNFTTNVRPLQEHTVDEIRQMFGGKFKEYALSDDIFALLLRLLQGGGKTFTTLTEAREIDNARILYAAPRHEIITALEAEGLIDRHIYPRDQKHCEQSQLAAFYGNKRYNVIQKVCSKKCELGMNYCEYFKQFAPIKAGEIVGIVHEYLFIPTYMEKLLENTSDEDIPTVVIFDEPDPQKFFETVNITSSNITEAISCWWSTGTKALLVSIRTAIEKLKQEERFTGKKAIERMLAEIPNDTILEHLLETAKRYASIPDRCKPVKFNRRVDASKRGNAMLFAFDGKQVWIPVDAFWVVDEDENIMLLEPWVIERDELTPIPESDVLPLNFLSDLANTLMAEYEKYQNGSEYNSLITIGRLPGLKHPILRLNLPKPFSVPDDTKLVLLDGSGIPELLEVLANRENERWEIPMQPDVEVIQITDGAYGKTTLTNPKSTAGENLIKLANQIASEAPDDTVIFTWQDIETVIREKQAAGEFPMQVEIDHYGNLEGKNDYEDKQTVILLGTPTPNPKDMIELAAAIWRDDTPLDTETIKTGNYRSYQYVDAQSNGCAVEVREYKDARLNMILHTYREQELVQAAHRIRPILYPGKRIYLLTNMPLDTLPPSRLTTIKELLTETSTEFKEFTALIQEIVKVHSGGWKELIMNMSKNQNVISTMYLLHSGFYSLPTGGTLQRWFNMAVSNLGYVSNNVNFPQLGLAKPLKVFHDGNLDMTKIEKLYQQVSSADADLTGKALEVWNWIKNNVSGQNFTAENVANAVGMDVRYATRHLKHFISIGLVEVVSCGKRGRGSATVYRMK